MRKGGSITETILKTAAGLRRKYENIRFHFYSGDAMDVLERLEHGNLDFAVMLEPVDTVKYDFLSLPEHSEWGVLMKSDCEFAQKQVVTQTELQKMPLILHQRIGLQEEIAHWAQTDLEHLQIAATYNVVHGSPVSFVRQKLGYFLTTRDLLAPNLDADVCFCPLRPSLQIKYALVWKKHAVFGRASGAFLDAVRTGSASFSESAI